MRTYILQSQRLVQTENTNTTNSFPPNCIRKLHKLLQKINIKACNIYFARISPTLSYELFTYTCPQPTILPQQYVLIQKSARCNKTCEHNLMLFVDKIYVTACLWHVSTHNGQYINWYLLTKPQGTIISVIRDTGDIIRLVILLQECL